MVRLREHSSKKASTTHHATAIHERGKRAAVKQLYQRIAISSPQTPRGPRYQVIAATIPLAGEDLLRACEGGHVLPLGPRGLDPLRLVTILGPYGDYVGSGELTLDEHGFIGLRVLSLATVARADQVQRPDRGWPPTTP